MRSLGANGKIVRQEPDPRASTDPASLFSESAELVARLYAESRCGDWGIGQHQFQAALEQSVRKRFSSVACSPETFAEYLGTLYVRDLGLACACMHGSESAWEYFVREYRGYLRAAGSAVTKGSCGGADGRELADSLFAELFGLVDGRRGERSLFRYFHGRSSLKTWLRAILAQRYVDKIRESRRWESLPDHDGEEPKSAQASNLPQPVLDPHRQKYLTRFCAALEASLRSLDADDRRRLELYYARQKTLGEIGRLLGEHESSVSRSLERIRRGLRARVEQQLRSLVPERDGMPCLTPMSEAEIALCLQYAAEETPIDFGKLFPENNPRRLGPGRKEMP